MPESDIMDKPRFSIVVPTYNTTDVLGQCLGALRDQLVDKKYFEVIVVNDGGRNAVPMSLDSHRNEISIRYLYQDHKGPAAARNLGIDEAKGDIILFLDDDSLPTKDWLTAVMEAWERYPDSAGIGGYILGNPRDNIFCRVNTVFFNWYLKQYSNNKHHPFLTTCNAGYKKGLLQRVDNFDERFKRASGEDRDLNIRISKMGGSLRLDENILVYHDRDLSFRSFIRKYYNYGKAAHVLYNRYPDLESLSSREYLNCYKSIIGQFSSFREKVMAFLLLTLSQVSTFAGYHTALLLRQKV